MSIKSTVSKIARVGCITLGSTTFSSAAQVNSFPPTQDGTGATPTSSSSPTSETLSNAYLNSLEATDLWQIPVGSQLSVSRDGKFIAFVRTLASGAIHNPEIEPFQEIAFFDRGQNKIHIVARCKLSDGTFQHPAFSGDGRHLVFTATADGLVPSDHNNKSDVYVYHLDTKSFSIISSNGNGDIGNDDSFTQSHASISFDGKYVAFTSLASNFSSNDKDKNANIYRKNTETGQLELISRAVPQKDGKVVDANSGSIWPSISYDGRYVAYMSSASNLIAVDTNQLPDIFLFDSQLGTTERVHVGSFGRQVKGIPLHPVISGNGRFIAFSSDARRLVDEDQDSTRNIFIVDTKSKKVISIVPPPPAGELLSRCDFPSLSSDGRYACFYAEFVQKDNPNVKHAKIYLHDITANKQIYEASLTEIPSGIISIPSIISGDGTVIVQFDPGKFDAEIANRLPYPKNLLAINEDFTNAQHILTNNNALSFVNEIIGKYHGRIPQEGPITAIATSKISADALKKIPGDQGKKAIEGVPGSETWMPQLGKGIDAFIENTDDRARSTYIARNQAPVAIDTVLPLLLLSPQTSIDDVSKKSLVQFALDPSLDPLIRGASLFILGEHSGEVGDLDSHLVDLLGDKDLGKLSAYILSKSQTLKINSLQGLLDQEDYSGKENVLFLLGLSNQDTSSHLLQIESLVVASPDKSSIRDSAFFALRKIVKKSHLDSKIIDRWNESKIPELNLLAAIFEMNQKGGSERGLKTVIALFESHPDIRQKLFGSVPDMGQEATKCIDIVLKGLSTSAIDDDTAARALAAMGEMGFQAILKSLWPDTMGGQGRSLLKTMSRLNPDAARTCLIAPDTPDNPQIRKLILIEAIETLANIEVIEGALCDLVETSKASLLRSAAAKALAYARQDSERVKTALSAGVKSSDDELKANCLSSLLALDSSSEETINLCKEILKKAPDWEIRKKIALSMFDRGIRELDVLEVIARGMFHTTSLHQMSQTRKAFEKMGPNGADILPFIMDEFARSSQRDTFYMNLHALKKGGAISSHPIISDLDSRAIEYRKKNKLEDWKKLIQSHLTELIEIARSGNLYDQFEALGLLGQLNLEDDDLTSLFADKINDPSLGIQMRALLNIPELVLSKPKILDIVLGKVKDQTLLPSMRDAAIVALQKGPNTPQVTQALLEIYEHSDSSRRTLIITIAAKIGIIEFLPNVVAAATNAQGNLETRQAAIRTIGLFHEKASSSWKELLPILNDERLQADTASTLVLIKAPSDALVKALIPLLKCTKFDEEVAHDKKGEPKAKTNSDSVATLFGYFDMKINRRALSAVLGAQGVLALPELAKALSDPHPSVIAGVAGAVAHMPPEATLWFAAHPDDCALFLKPLMDAAFPEIREGDLPKMFNLQENAEAALRIIGEPALIEIEKRFASEGSKFNPDCLDVVCSMGEIAVPYLDRLIEKFKDDYLFNSHLPYVLHKLGLRALPVVVKLQAVATARVSWDNFFRSAPEYSLMPELKVFSEDKTKPELERGAAVIWMYCASKTTERQMIEGALFEVLLQDNIPGAWKYAALDSIEQNVRDIKDKLKFRIILGQLIKKDENLYRDKATSLLKLTSSP